MSAVVRVMIVDDKAIVRKALQMHLSLEADIELVGEASDGEAALRLVADLKPDVVLMDLEMPIMDGFAATSLLHDQFPDVRVIILSIRGDQDSRNRALSSGARAFVEKRLGAGTLIDTIREVAG